jgi:hypothetical protein
MVRVGVMVRELGKKGRTADSEVQNLSADCQKGRRGVLASEWNLEFIHREYAAREGGGGAYFRSFLLSS